MIVVKSIEDFLKLIEIADEKKIEYVVFGKRFSGKDRNSSWKEVDTISYSFYLASNQMEVYVHEIASAEKIGNKQILSGKVKCIEVKNIKLNETGIIELAF